MTQNNSLIDNCEVVTQEEGDRFVGLKASTDEVKIYFPLGYDLPETDKELRKDIIHLLSVLHEFTGKEKIIPIKKYDSPNKVNFPLNAYLEIIRYYMENGYYIETDPIYKTRDKGKINWSKTIKNQRPLLQKNSNGNYSPIYTSFTVRLSNPNENKEITRIHQHCVYESFKKLGWIFTSFMPPKPEGSLETKRFLIVLQKKISNTNNDMKKRLFQSMIDMLSFMDVNSDKKDFFYGTDNFESVWEQLIDKAFGIKNKDEYFPRTRWFLHNNKSGEKDPLLPDTIMIKDDKIYVIDAKYYKFGATGYFGHLPSTSSVHKQITYGEFIKEEKNKDPKNIYNAFLMPYNMNDNPFDYDGEFENIGVAVSDWKSNKLAFEHVQGLLVDTRFLMYAYNKDKESNTIRLAEAIEKAYIKNEEFLKSKINL